MTMTQTADISIKVALADDHSLLRIALANLINGFDNCEVIIEARTGKELIAKIVSGLVPNIVLLDLNMPEMDGYETAAWLKENQPAVKVLMLTMYDSEQVLIRLLKAGVKGFLKKDIHPEELKSAIQSVMQTGFYYSPSTSSKLADLFRKQPDDSSIIIEKILLTDAEIQFMKLVSSDLTYKEIAEHMHLNPRAVDSMRDHLFEKLSVKSRVGLAMYAIKQGIVTF